MPPASWHSSSIHANLVSAVCILAGGGSSPWYLLHKPCEVDAETLWHPETVGSPAKRDTLLHNRKPPSGGETPWRDPAIPTWAQAMLSKQLAVGQRRCRLFGKVTWTAYTKYEIVWVWYMISLYKKTAIWPRLKISWLLNSAMFMFMLLLICARERLEVAELLIWQPTGSHIQ